VRVRVPVDGSGEHGALFANPGVMLIESWCNRGIMFISDLDLVPVDDVPKWALVQFRGTMLIEAL